MKYIITLGETAYEYDFKGQRAKILWEACYDSITGSKASTKRYFQLSTTIDILLYMWCILSTKSGYSKSFADFADEVDDSDIVAFMENFTAEQSLYASPEETIEDGEKPKKA